MPSKQLDQKTEKKYKERSDAIPTTWFGKWFLGYRVRAGLYMQPVEHQVLFQIIALLLIGIILWQMKATASTLYHLVYEPSKP